MSETTDPLADPGAPPAMLILPINPPIEFQGAKYDTLTLREPTAGQKRTASEQLRNGTNAATVNLYEIHMVSQVSAAPIAVIERLPVSTLNKAMGYIDYFLDAGRRTGWI